MIGSIVAEDKNFIEGNFITEQSFSFITTPIKLENLTSPNPFNMVFWKGVYGKGLYIFCGDDMYRDEKFIYYSSDGINYNPCTINFDLYSIDRIYFLKNKFFITFNKIQNGRRYGAYSIDGINWYELSIPDLYNLSSFASDNNTLYAYGYGINTPNTLWIWSSSDDVNFTLNSEYSIPQVGNYVPSNIYYGNKVFVHPMSHENKVAISKDGLNWIKYDFDNACPSEVSFFKDKFIGNLSNGYCIYSYNAFNWMAGNAVRSSISNLNVGENFCCGFYNNLLLFSSDGINWFTFPLPSSIDNQCNCIIHDKFYFKNEEGNLYYIQL